ncbi:MAG: sensory box histidine kinase, partial [Acidobacteria bacterium]|nr:sensory box histidine kinase [Acidobacteriota bacterium]
AVQLFPLIPDLIVVSFTDITKQHLAQEALRQSELHFRSLFERSHDAILVFDPRDERVLEANARACELYGMAPEELVGTSLRDFSWGNTNRSSALLQEVMERGLVDFQTTQRRRDGTPLDLDIRATRVDYYGLPAVLTVNRDISAVLAGERQYRAVVENVPAVLWSGDEEGTRHFVSSRVNAVLGIAVTEIIGIPGAWERLIHPSDRPAVEEAYRALFAEGAAFDVEYRIQHTEGRLVWISDHAHQPYERGGRRLVDGVMRDITARKLAEEQQSAVADFSLMALLEQDVDSLMDEGCRTVERHVGSDIAMILQHLPERREFQVRLARGWQVSADGMRLPDSVERLPGYAMSRRDPVFHGELGDESRFIAPLFTSLGIKSGVSVIIDGPRAPFGVFAAASFSSDAFSESDVAFVRSIASIVAAAIARRDAEDEMQRARTEYETLIEVAQEGVVVIAPDGTLRFANAKAAELVGREVSEIVGMPFLELVVAEDQPLLSGDAGALLTRETGQLDVRLRRPDRAVVWASIASSPMISGEGRLVSVLAMISDISARVRAEEELRRRTMQLVEAQTIARIGSFEYDADSDEMFWSDELYTITGVDPSGSPFSRERRFGMLEALRGMGPSQVVERLTDGGPIDLQHEMLRADGSPRFVHTKVRAVADPVTGRLRVIGTVQDITEERLAQQEVLEREARLRLIVSHLPVIIFSTDVNLCVTSMVGAGLQEDSVAELGLTLNDFFEPPPEGTFMKGVLQGTAVTFESRRDESDMRINIEPLREVEGNIVGAVGIAYDVTEQNRYKRAQLELLEVVHRAALEWSETFDSISSPIVIIGGDGRVGRVNGAALELSGARSLEEVVGRPVTALGGSPLWSELAEVAAGSRQAGKPLTVRIRTTDEQHWDILASPWSTADRITVVASNVTALTKMQERLQRSEKMSAVGSLLAGVAHEVRNPLFGISATLDAFDATYNDVTFQPFVSALREPVNRLNELMHDLLEFGRPVTPEFQVDAIAPVVTAARSSVRALARQERVLVLLHMPPDLPPVWMNGRRMQQVFENLLKNAIQHSPPDAIVEVLGHSDHASGTVSVTVQDQGPGFAAADGTRIFEPFFTRRRGGTGLGLSLVQRIVDDHNGSIVTANRPGGGASVTVSFSAAAAVV